MILLVAIVVVGLAPRGSANPAKGLQGILRVQRSNVTADMVGAVDAFAASAAAIAE
jgi:hypothetical protein